MKPFTINPDLGEFPAYLTNEGDVGIVIFVHGFRGDYSREVFAKMRAGEIVDMGYRSMIISYRNDKGLRRIHLVFFNMVQQNGKILTGQSIKL